MLFAMTVDYFTWEKTINFEEEMIHMKIYKDLKSNTSEKE